MNEFNTGDIIYSRDEAIKHLLSKWANYVDGDLCHDATEILEPLCELFEIPINRKLTISKEEFCAGCANYQDKLFVPKNVTRKSIFFPQVFCDE